MSRMIDADLLKKVLRKDERTFVDAAEDVRVKEFIKSIYQTVYIDISIIQGGEEPND